MTIETISEQPATGAPSLNVPTETSLQVTAPEKYRVIRRGRRLAPFDESKIRRTIANKTLVVMAVLVFGVFCSEAEAGCVAESELYVEQTPNMSKQAEPCTEKQEDSVQGEQVLREELVMPKPDTHDRTEVSNSRPHDDTTVNQPPEESTTVDVHEFIKDHWGKGFSILAILMFFRERLLRTGSVLAASGTVVG